MTSRMGRKGGSQKILNFIISSSLKIVSNYFSSYEDYGKCNPMARERVKDLEGMCCSLGQITDTV